MARGERRGRLRVNESAGVIETQGVAQNGPVAGVYYVDTGDCELVPDDDNPNGWLLKINGVQSSHIDLADPLQLSFEYMRWIAELVHQQFPQEPGARLRALHLGGGACSLARYFHSAYPDARQVVVELDGKLANYVRDWFKLPKAPLLRIRVGEAREVTETLTDDSRDLIIRDVFAGAFTPYLLTTREFTEHAARVLAPGGLYVVNSGDAPDLKNARQEAATIASVFPHAALIADPPMLKGRRYGNIIFAGSDRPIEDGAKLRRQLLGGAVPAQIWNNEQVRDFARGAKVRVDDAPAAQK
ncbi:spermidine synthase [Pseudarthrobacter sp. J1763]|uniref:spermidine synthase n=1 Tax=Pseudarthrobacter sp. J1763 TaxID=3420445 RepID=UPI003D2750D9